MNKPSHHLFSVIIIAAFALILRLPSHADQNAAIIIPEPKTDFEAPDEVDFNFHVKPILSDRCFTCHGPDESYQIMGLRLDQAESAYAPNALGDGRRIVPGKPEESEVVRRIRARETHLRMPPPDSNLSLDEREIALIERWIEQGAEYKPHWSFIPPSNNDLPADAHIDLFIDEVLHQQGLIPTEHADKETLLRRLTFDLTGLPPTVEEIDAFLADDSPDAYERVVERLLASPHYGERMAVDWLDAARFADTFGYQGDHARPMWRWRDWVIDAFNDNMPFDEFILWQLAGDLPPNPSREQILATAFNRNHPQNAEGGIINEEFRVEYVADRTNTFGQVFMGITLDCARCHDHKFDPISHKEYYQLFSFFNNVDEAGQITWSQRDMPSPTLLLFDEEQEQEREILKAEIAALEERIQSRIDNLELAPLEDWLTELPDNRGETPSGLVAYYSLANATHTFIADLVGNATGRIVDPVTLRPLDAPLDFVESRTGYGIRLDGDSMLDFPGVGRFSRAEPFSVGLWVYLPEEIERGVIFHANRGGILYAFKGYQVSLDEGRFDIRFAHTFPYNSIHLLSDAPAPKNQWFHIMLTYDGSSRASGVRFYVNGVEWEMAVQRDNLYKEIVFEKENIPTNLRVGARWRSRGLTGGAVDGITVYDRALTPLEAAEAAGVLALTSLRETPVDPLTEEEQRQLHLYRLHVHDEEFASWLAELQSLRAKKNAIAEEAEEIMVMAEMEDPRPAFVLNRGLYSEPRERVFPDTPASILPFPDDLPRNRLGLAEWLTHPDHPLTARVIVNRLWQQCFGRGIVATPEDFGAQGELPSHPELLDWLALRFIESGWDVKAMLKTIVMSDAYQRSSIASPELLAKDPENIWLARGPSRRLRAEMMRDQALAASGLLVSEIGGPSVKPYQPEGLWSFSMGATYVQDTGDKLYRRSLYTFWKQTIPPPTMNIFDAPSRSYCVVRREATNTPLQALVLMNDPQFVEACKALAQRVMQDQENPEDRLAMAFRLLASRSPNPEELKVLLAFYANQRERFAEEPARAEGWLSAGEFVPCSELDPIELAAHAVAVNAILNSDAAIMKR